jgi:hypothetical protein
MIGSLLRRYGFPCLLLGVAACGVTSNATTQPAVVHRPEAQLALNRSADGADPRPAPAPAAAVGYTYEAANLGPFDDLSSVDCDTHRSGKAFYTGDFAVAAAPCSMFSVSGGNLVLNDRQDARQTTVGSMAPDGTGDRPALDPPAGWVGSVFGPGFYMEATVKFPASNMRYPGNWPALWGNTFWNYAHNLSVQGVEIDWAEWFKESDNAYGTGSHDWFAPSTRNDYGCTCNQLPSSGVDTFHTYAILVVPSQDNGGSGYIRFFLDGRPQNNAHITWIAGGPNSRLDTTPFGYLVTPGAYGSFTIKSLRVFVKDSTRVIRH